MLSFSQALETKNNVENNIDYNVYQLISHYHIYTYYNQSYFQHRCFAQRLAKIAAMNKRTIACRKLVVYTITIISERGGPEHQVSSKEHQKFIYIVS